MHNYILTVYITIYICVYIYTYIYIYILYISLVNICLHDTFLFTFHVDGGELIDRGSPVGLHFPGCSGVSQQPREDECDVMVPGEQLGVETPSAQGDDLCGPRGL